MFLVSTKIAHLNFKWIPQKHLNLTKENTINLIKWGKVEEEERRENIFIKTKKPQKRKIYEFELIYLGKENAIVNER